MGTTIPARSTPDLSILSLEIAVTLHWNPQKSSKEPHSGRIRKRIETELYLVVNYFDEGVIGQWVGVFPLHAQGI